jgi:exodeoxyribonuclease VII large subunit
MAKEKIWTVSEVNSAIREVVEGGFMPFWIEGEIGTINAYRSGHVYMTLKDKRSQIRAVFFGGAERVEKMKLAKGSAIEAYGNLSVYEVRGEYQFAVRSIRPLGMGDLHRKFEELKNKLAAEGLFDETKKKKIPPLPKTIGVVTSPDGAAIRDFLQILTRRFPNIQVKIYPAKVQGPAAAAEIAEGIGFFNQKHNVDVIVVTRGGGSIEDLWAFNEEIVARAVAESPTPTVSAVGHEIDFTICDFAADLRAPTPSAAAELVVDEMEAFLENLSALRGKLDAALELAIEKLARKYERAASNPVFSEPKHLLRQHQQKLDELSSRLDSLPNTSIDKAKAKFDKTMAALRNLDPKAVLQRGYSIILERDSGKTVTSPNIPTQTPLKAILAKGELNMRSE